MRIPLFLVVFLLCTVTLSAARELDIRLSFGQEASSVTCAVELAIPEGYHAYSHETDDVGRPTELEFFLEDTPVTAVRYPRGAVQRDLYSPEASAFIYEGTVVLFASLPEDAPGKRFRGTVSLLLCSSRNCIPVNQEFSGRIPGSVQPAETQHWYAQKLETEEHPIDASTNPLMDTSSDASRPSEKELPPVTDFAVQLTPQYAENSVEVSSLWQAIAIGLVAGLLLNFMPCVLPVLTFKLQGMLSFGHKCTRRRIHQFRAHNLCLSLGILTFFSVLAIVLGTMDCIWGQFFQNQTVLLFLLVVIFLLGLSLLGVFTLPVLDLKIHRTTKRPLLQAYCTGLLTTLLATPCSGPLLGGVLGWTFTQPMYSIVLVFWFIGIGMSMPYIVSSIWPQAVFLLPRSGPWMKILEHCGGFFLLGTALYLLSILPPEKHVSILAVLLLVTAVAWLWGQVCSRRIAGVWKHVSWVLGVCMVITACSYILRPSPERHLWEEFSAEEFTSQLGKNVVLVEFTADWCPNCKFVERTVLTDTTVSSLKDKAEVSLFKADLTQANAVATYLLTELGSHSIPLTAIFPKGERASSPIVLRDVYGTELLKKSFDLALSQSR